MNSFSELITKRRSTRKFTEEELSQDEVVALLKAALMSPSSKRSNCWQFVVVDKKELLEGLYCKAHGAELIANAPLAIVVLGDPLLSDVWIEDASIASIMIQLQAEDLGLGSCWVQIRERYTEDDIPADEIVRGLLNIPLQMQVLSIIAVGHKATERKPFDEEQLQWEKVHINSFGQED